MNDEVVVRQVNSTIRTFGFWAKINTLNTYTPLLGDIGTSNLFRYANNFF